MPLITLLLMLIVAAVIIYGVKLALAGNWRDLIITVIILILALWILGALGLSIPNVPRVA